MRYVAAIHKAHPGQVIMFRLSQTVPDRAYWGAYGPSQTSQRDLEIVKDYGLVFNSEDGDQIAHQFMKDYPPVPYDLETSESALVDGFVSPTGDFYRGEYMGHSSLALDLLEAFFDIIDPDNAEDELIKQGYMSIRAGFAVCNEGIATSAQLQWLVRLSELTAKHDAYNRRVQSSLEMLKRRIAAVD